MTLSNITPDWLKTQLADPEQEKPVLTILGSEVMTQRECEKKLLALIGHSKFQLARILLKNRFTIYFGTLFTQATTDLEKKPFLSSWKNTNPKPERSSLQSWSAPNRKKRSTRLRP